MFNTFMSQLSLSLANNSKFEKKDDTVSSEILLAMTTLIQMSRKSPHI